MKKFVYEKAKFKILDKIKGPKDLKNLDLYNLNLLCSEIRLKILHTVAKNGGHLASNLGVVELTVALHKQFNSPKDRIVWDTGHQTYAHKLLTGRFEKFDSLRKKNGISPFISPKESEHDSFIAGHASNSLSAACGIAISELLKKTKNYVVVVVGDGSLTGGLIYEALNNAIDLSNLIVVFNYNFMSISKTVGNFSNYVKKTKLEKNVDLFKFLKSLGFFVLDYVEGHDVEEIENAFIKVKNVKKPAIIQVFTKKGEGFEKAEKNPELYHFVGPFDVEKGFIEDEKLTFSKVFGEEIVKIAEKDKKICAITAAMEKGTGLSKFRKKFPDRFFDVGIAEEHAVVFAAGLFVGGMVPVLAIYSTFLQRAYDQLVHDVAIENSHVVLVIDRAGFVEDGKTHQGFFDVSFLSTIPNVTIYAPATYEEVKHMLKKAIYDDRGIVAVRYPKGEEIKNLTKKEYSDFLVVGEGEVAVATYGTLFENILKAKVFLNDVGLKIAAVKINKIFPIEKDVINCLKKYSKIIFFEEGMKNGGIAEHLILKLLENGFRGSWNIKAVDGIFVEHSTKKQAFENLGFDVKSIVKFVLNKTKHNENFILKQ